MNHNIAELRRQFEAAQSKAKQAISAEEDARKRLIDAMIEAADAEWASRGISFGQKVVCVKNEDPLGSVNVGYVGVFMGHTKPHYSIAIKPVIAKLKKDGTAHSVQTWRSYGAVWEAAE